MAIANLFFDLDGTLVDSFPGISYSCGVAIARVMPGMQPPDFRPFIGPPIREIFRRAFPDIDAVTLDRLVQSFRTSYNSDGWQKTRAFPGVEKVLARVFQSGYVSRVLTNKPKLPTMSILHHLGIDRFFTEVITPDGQPPGFASKVEAALDARRRHDLAGASVLVIGDSDDDGAAAAACGFQFAAVTFGYGRAHEHCNFQVHYRLEQFDHLLNIL